MTMQRVITDVLLAGRWVDISTSVRQADAHVITRGRGNWLTSPPPARCDLTIDNAGGVFSPRNPTSPYYGLIGRNTPLRVAVATTDDPFTRTTANGFGTAPSGQVWSTSGGAASDQSTNGTKALHSAGTRAVNRFSLVPAAGPDVCPTVTISTAVLSATAPFRAGLVARYVDANNYYLADLEFNVAGGAVHLELWQIVGGVAVQLQDFTATGLTHAADTEYRLALDIRQTTGTDLDIRANVWRVVDGEPETWMIDTTDAGGGLPAIGSIGLRTRIDATNTSTLPVVFTFDDFQDRNYRFYGEVSEWPNRWDLAGVDVYMPIQASGITRRMGQGATPLRSALYRDISRRAGVISYWPMEDGDTARQLAAGPPDGTGPMRITGRIKAGAGDQPGIGSAPVISRGDGGPDASGAPTGTIAPTTATTWTMLGLFYMTTEPDNLSIMEVHAGGGIETWWLYGDATTNELILEGYNPDGVVVISDAFTPTAAMFGQWLYFYFMVEQIGADLFWAFGFYDGLGVLQEKTGSIASVTAGPPRTVMPVGVGSGAVSIGHVIVMAGDERTAPIGAMTGWAGETAAARIGALCLEESLPFELVGDTDQTQLVGIQRVATLLDLLNDAAAADMGLLFERRYAFGLAYRTHASLYNQTALALDYAAGHIAPPFDPVDDDQAVRNDITVKRFNGSSAQYVQETGPLNVQDPWSSTDPNAVGRYEDGPTLHVHQDQQLPDLARWRAHLGTWDESRYPAITVADLVAFPALAGAISALDLGDRVTIANPPEWLPPDLIDVIVQGSTERIDQVSWSITLNAAPAGPYNVAVFDDPVLGKLGTDGSTLAEDLTTTETAVDVATTSALMPLWVTAGGEFPFDIRVGGERMTVTAIAGAASPQTFTVVRSVNGVVKTHATGADVQLWTPAVLAL